MRKHKCKCDSIMEWTGDYLICYDCGRHIWPPRVHSSSLKIVCMAEGEDLPLENTQFYQVSGQFPSGCVMSAKNNWKEPLIFPKGKPLWSRDDEC